MIPYQTSNENPTSQSLGSPQCNPTETAKDPAVAAHLSDAKGASSRMHTMFDTLEARLSGVCDPAERPLNPVSDRPMHGSSDMAQVIRQLEDSFESAENRLRDLLSRLEI